MEKLKLSNYVGGMKHGAATFKNRDHWQTLKSLCTQLLLDSEIALMSIQPR
jgi:hypothetical protein